MPFFKKQEKVKASKMYLPALLPNQISPTKHKLKGRIKAMKRTTVEHKTKCMASCDCRGHMPTGSALSSSIWAFLYPTHPPKDESKVAFVGKIMKCPCSGPLLCSAPKMAKVVPSFIWQKSPRTLSISYWSLNFPLVCKYLKSKGFIFIHPRIYHISYT